MSECTADQSASVDWETPSRADVSVVVCSLLLLCSLSPGPLWHPGLAWPSFKINSLWGWMPRLLDHPHHHPRSRPLLPEHPRRLLPLQISISVVVFQIMILCVTFAFVFFLQTSLPFSLEHCLPRAVHHHHHRRHHHLWLPTRGTAC